MQEVNVQQVSMIKEYSLEVDMLVVNLPHLGRIRRMEHR
jgi:hypothetical protein